MPKRTESLGRDPLSWIGDRQSEGKQGTQGRSSKQSRPSKPSKPKYQRATFHLNVEYIEKLRDEAYWDRISIKDLMDQILSEHFKGKKIKSRP